MGHFEIENFVVVVTVVVVVKKVNVNCVKFEFGNLTRPDIIIPKVIARRLQKFLEKLNFFISFFVCKIFIRCQICVDILVVLMLVKLE